MDLLELELCSKYYLKSFYYKREGIIEPIDEKKKKFNSSTLNADLQELSSETTISDFNEMSQDIRGRQITNIQEQTIAEDEWGKDAEWDGNIDEEGWEMDDDW